MVKNPPACAGDAEDAGWISGSGRTSGVGNGNPLQYPYQKNSMDRGAWWATVHGGLKEPDMTEQRQILLIHIQIDPQLREDDRIKLCNTYWQSLISLIKKIFFN